MKIQVTAKVLAYTINSFNDDNGKSVEYARLHARTDEGKMIFFKSVVNRDFTVLVDKECVITLDVVASDTKPATLKVSDVEQA